MSKIKTIHAREVLDSRGFPTVEAEILLDNSITARAIVPSGASTGQHEALELRDGDPKRYLGKGVLTAVQNVNQKIAKLLVGQNPADVWELDKKMIEADGSDNKKNLGANAILAVSLAWSKAKAKSENLTLAEWIYKSGNFSDHKPEMQLPIPLMNIINGGAHADNGLDIQEFMIVPHSFGTFSEALRAGSEVFHQLKKILLDKSLATSVGDEGGFAPNLATNIEALDLILVAIEKAGYRPGEEISLALDVAASEFYKDGYYCFKDKSLAKCDAATLIDYFKKLCEKYPMISIEDPCDENDWQSWTELTKSLGDRVQVVGDDLFVTQIPRLTRGIKEKAANSILIKLNQVGSLSETIDCMKLAAKSSFTAVASHRSGETEDSTLAHLAVGSACGQIKTGSLSRSDRLCKYNELLRLEERLKISLTKNPWQ